MTQEVAMIGSGLRHGRTAADRNVRGKLYLVAP